MIYRSAKVAINNERREAKGCEMSDSNKKTRLKDALIAWAVKNVPQWPEHPSDGPRCPDIRFKWFRTLGVGQMQIGSYDLNISVYESEWKRAGGGIE